MCRRRFCCGAAATCAAALATGCASIGNSGKKDALDVSATAKYGPKAPVSTAVACCGLNCAKCQVFVATQSSDQAARQKMADEWSENTGEKYYPSDFTCYGCQGESGVLAKITRICVIRPCTKGKSLPNCAHCPQYACEDKLKPLLDEASEAKTALELIRQTIG